MDSGRPCVVLGPGIPFALGAPGLTWVSNVVAIVRRDIRAVSMAGASALVVPGVLMVSGVREKWVYQLQDLEGAFSTSVQSRR